MKVWQRVAAALTLVAALGLAGCQSKSNANAQGNGSDGQGQFPQIQGTMGIVTDISDSSITIAVMPQGQGFGGQGGNRAQGGTNRARGSGSPQRTAPADNGQNGDAAARPTMDTSSWEKKTFTIDSSTKITQMSRGNGSSGQSATLKASDITTGESVAIAERSGKTGTADTINVMGAMGRGGFDGGQGAGPDGQQGNPDGNAPSSTNKA
jgi:hypothetical protein